MYTHTVMTIDQLDSKLICEPLSKEERLNYIKIFLDKIYLTGIDKGTVLEQARIKKINYLKDQKFEAYFQGFCEYIEENINIAEKKVYREKYKGRYNYYKPKKKKSPKKEKTTKPEKPKKYFQHQLW